MATNKKIYEYEDTTTNISAKKRAKLLAFDTTKDCFTYYKSDGTTLRHLLTMDSSNNFLTAIGNGLIGSGSYFGLGGSAGRIVYTNAATDALSFMDCNVGIGTETPANILHVYKNANEACVTRTENVNTGSGVTVGHDIIADATHYLTVGQYGANTAMATGGQTATGMGIIINRGSGLLFCNYDAQSWFFANSTNTLVTINGSTGLATFAGAATVTGNLTNSALTATGILYAGAAGLLSTNHTVFNYNATTNSGIGIGTTAAAGCRAYLYHSVTNTSDLNTLIVQSDTTGTSAAAYNNTAFYIQARFYGTANNTGAIYGAVMDAYGRNTLGTLTYLTCFNLNFGKYSGAGNIGTATGLSLAPIKCATSIIDLLIGLYFNAPTGTGTATTQRPIYSSWDAQSQFVGGITILSDANYLKWGAGEDCGIYYDGTDMRFNSRLVGTGNFLFNSGNVCINNGFIETFTATDSNADLSINYNGYNGGTTRFRGTIIYNGKGGVVGYWNGIASMLCLGTVNNISTARLEIWDTTEAVRMVYNANNYCKMAVGAGGELTITCTPAEGTSNIILGANTGLDMGTNSNPFFICRTSASAQPTPGTGELRIWRDSDDDKVYLVYTDTNAGTKKVELT